MSIAICRDVLTAKRLAGAKNTELVTIAFEHIRRGCDRVDVAAHLWAIGADIAAVFVACRGDGQAASLLHGRATAIGFRPAVAEAAGLAAPGGAA